MEILQQNIRCSNKNTQLKTATMSLNLDKVKEKQVKQMRKLVWQLYLNPRL